MWFSHTLLTFADCEQKELLPSVAGLSRIHASSCDFLVWTISTPSDLWIILSGTEILRCGVCLRKDGLGTLSSMTGLCLNGVNILASVCL